LAATVFWGGVFLATGAAFFAGAFLAGAAFFVVVFLTAFVAGAAREGVAFLAGTFLAGTFLAGTFFTVLAAFFSGTFTGLAAPEAFEALGISFPLTKGAGG
jgi:hypothetical protein